MPRLPEFQEMLDRARENWPQHPSSGPMTKREEALLEVTLEAVLDIHDKSPVALNKDRPTAQVDRSSMEIQLLLVSMPIALSRHQGQPEAAGRYAARAVRAALDAMAPAPEQPPAAVAKVPKRLLG